MASGTGFFSPAVDPQGDYTYTLSGNAPCSFDEATISVTVNPIPDAGTNGTKTFCSNATPEDLFLSLGGTPQTGGIWSPTLASGTGVFNSAVDIAQTYTYTVGSTCNIPSTATVSVAVTPAPNSGGIGQTLNTCTNITSLDLFTGLDGTQQVGTWNDDNATGALVNNIFNPATVGVGTYDFTYTVVGISPCADANSTVTVIVNPLPNAGTATTIPPVCPSVGIIDLTSLLSGENTGGIWTDNGSQIVTSPINIINFAAGTYNYAYTVTNTCGTFTTPVQFTVLANPILTTTNITIFPSCNGTDTVVNLNGLVDGTYTLNYDLNGSNVSTNQTVVVTITAGIGSFTIPTASIPNVGTTVISFTSIVNNTSTCSNTLTNVTAQIVVRPLADIDNANLSIANVCVGNNVVVNITNATNLPDGVYQFNYSIPGAAPTTGNSGNVTMTAGTGQFIIPSSSFTTTGNYTLTVFGIIATTGCTNSNENATATFSVNPVPNVTGGTILGQATCPNFSSVITISGATNLADGSYSITYQLSGANNATATVIVTFTAGVATFTIPGTELVNVGDTTITINQFNSTVSTCGVTGNVFNPFTFSVATPGTPTLITTGNVFCGVDFPTIANLSANIVGTPIVIWYNAATGGTAYSDTDALVDGTTYYATLVAASGCESVIRLEVTVTICSDILIPDGYSPNNDGINDTFEIPNLAILYPNFKLEIYNRYGNLIYTGNKNKPNWGGTTTESGLNLGDNLLPTGVYFYILDFNDGTRKAIQGRVYLNR
jgi:gliding motility-associated-like protein